MTSFANIRNKILKKTASTGAAPVALPATQPMPVATPTPAPIAAQELISSPSVPMPTESPFGADTSGWDDQAFDAIDAIVRQNEVTQVADDAEAEVDRLAREEAERDARREKEGKKRKRQVVTITDDEGEDLPISAPASSSASRRTATSAPKKKAFVDDQSSDGFHSDAHSHPARTQSSELDISSPTSSSSSSSRRVRRVHTSVEDEERHAKRQKLQDTSAISRRAIMAAHASGASSDAAQAPILNEDTRDSVATGMVEDEMFGTQVIPQTPEPVAVAPQFAPQQPPQNPPEPLVLLDPATLPPFEGLKELDEEAFAFAKRLSPEEIIIAAAAANFYEQKASAEATLKKATDALTVLGTRMSAEVKDRCLDEAVRKAIVAAAYLMPDASRTVTLPGHQLRATFDRDSQKAENVWRPADLRQINVHFPASSKPRIVHTELVGTFVVSDGLHDIARTTHSYGKKKVVVNASQVIVGPLPNAGVPQANTAAPPQQATPPVQQEPAPVNAEEDEE